MDFFSFMLNSGLSILEWLSTSIGFLLLARKQGWQKRWQLWIPGLGYLRLGQELDAERDGWGYFIPYLLTVVLPFFPWENAPDKVYLGFILVQLILLVFRLIYRIRLGLTLLRAYHAKKTWLILWIFLPQVMLFILALSDRFQPDSGELDDEVKAGTAPAEIAGAEEHKGFAMTDTGLSIDLRERSVRDFSKKRYLLKDIQLNIPNGSLVLLLGGSGAGKTTFINAIIGYEKADATILLNGSDIYKDYGRMKYRIGFVQQQNLIRGSDTVLHTIDDAARLRIPREVPAEERKKKREAAMALMGLTAGSQGLVGKKSGGMLRRISIAMELVSDPELFVLDEPDSGLDGVIARELFTQLRAIADTGKIVLVITHTPDRVIDLFDKVIVLARDSGRCGRLGFYGSPDEARAFFERDSMEGVVLRVNSKDAGGEGLADEYIERYARLTAGKEEAAVQ